jgi:hypothetical protein
LTLQPAEDQRAVQVRQALPGVLLTGLRAEQQALSGARSWCRSVTRANGWEIFWFCYRLL